MKSSNAEVLEPWNIFNNPFATNPSGDLTIRRTASPSRVSAPNTNVARKSPLTVSDGTQGSMASEDTLLSLRTVPGKVEENKNEDEEYIYLFCQ